MMLDGPHATNGQPREPTDGPWAGVLGRIIAYGLGFALLWSLLFACQMHASFADVLWPFGIGAGIPFGLVVGGLVGARTRPVDIWIPMSHDDAEALVSRVKAHLLELSYRQVNGSFVFKPGLRLGLLAKSITLSVHAGRVHVSGPAHSIRKLERALASDIPYQ
jgi:hypothetical protein